jgi:hypothetical protein
LLENDNLEEERLINAVTTGVGEKVKGCPVLSIQDTSDINYWKNRNRIKDITALAEVSDNKGLGNFLHPSLVLDADDGEVKGCSDIYLSCRPWDRTYNKSTRKESYKWLVVLKSIRFMQHRTLNILLEKGIIFKTLPTNQIGFLTFFVVLYLPQSYAALFTACHIILFIIL